MNPHFNTGIITTTSGMSYFSRITHSNTARFIFQENRPTRYTSFHLFIIDPLYFGLNGYHHVSQRHYKKLSRPLHS